MGYRHHHGPDEPHHHMGLAHHSVIPVDNGTITRITIPCFSRGDKTPHHDREGHDHEGWPDPDHTDDSCQLPPYDRHHRHMVLDGIDLADIGYDSVEVVLHEPPEGLTATGYIDGSTVQLVIVAMCGDAELEDVHVKFAVYVLGTVTDEDDEEHQLRDVVTKGIVHIEAGPISDGSQWVDPTIQEKIAQQVLEIVAPDVLTLAGTASSEYDFLGKELAKGSYYIVAEDGYYGGIGCHKGDLIFITQDATPRTTEELSQIIVTTHQSTDTISEPEILEIVMSE